MGQHPGVGRQPAGHRQVRSEPPGLERDAGRIITVSSLAGKEPKPKLSAYASSKAAVIAFTKVLGQELAATNIAKVTR